MRRKASTIKTPYHTLVAILEALLSSLATAPPDMADLVPPTISPSAEGELGVFLELLLELLLGLDLELERDNDLLAFSSFDGVLDLPRSAAAIFF